MKKKTIKKKTIASDLKFQGRYDSAFGSRLVKPQETSVLEVIPPRTPFFEPKRILFTCLHSDNPNREMDLKIGSVTVGGSSQIALYCLNPDKHSAGIRPEDLHYQDVNWSIFSTRGLARELKMSIFNPNNDPVIAFAFLDGFDVQSLNEYDGKKTKKTKKPQLQEGYEIRERHASELDLTKMSGSDVEIDPFSHGVIRLTPTVSPFFDPLKIRFNGYNVDSGYSVPFSVVNAYCGDRLLYDASSMINIINSVVKHENNLYDFKRRLKILGGTKLIEDFIYGIQTGRGFSELGKRMDLEINKYDASIRKEDGFGMLTTHITRKDGWGDISWWPRISTIGLSKSAGILIYNPWPFRIRANATISGWLAHS